jgi:DNA-binding PadR family transcriptional regulator
MPKAIDPRSFLPLTPQAFQVLLALADGERHGYAIIREVDERTGGLITLRTGSLYTMLQRLLAARLIEDAPAAVARRAMAEDGKDDPRRRYYMLTSLGRDVVAAEARRLEAVVGEARRKHVFKST